MADSTMRTVIMASRNKYSRQTLLAAYPYRYLLLAAGPFVVLLGGFFWLSGGFVALAIGGIFFVLVWMFICWLIMIAGCMMLRLSCSLFVFNPDAPEPCFAPPPAVQPINAGQPLCVQPGQFVTMPGYAGPSGYPQQQFAAVSQQPTAVTKLQPAAGNEPPPPPPYEEALKL